MPRRFPRQKTESAGRGLESIAALINQLKREDPRMYQIVNTIVNDQADFPVNLDSDDVEGRLQYAHLQGSSSAARLLGRRSDSAGNWEEIAAQNGLFFDGATLNGLYSPGIHGREPWTAWAIQAIIGTLCPIGIPTTAFGNIGNAPTAGAATNTLTSLHTTSAVNGNICGFGTNTNFVIKRQVDFDLIMVIETIPTITSIRFWAGFTSSTTGVNADNWDATGTNNNLMFRFSTVAGDTGWKASSKANGANGTISAQVGSNLVAGVRQVLRIRMVNAGTPTAYFSVNDSAEVAVTATLPVANEGMNFVCTIITQTGAARSFEVSRIMNKFATGLT